MRRRSLVAGLVAAPFVIRRAWAAPASSLTLNGTTDYVRYASTPVTAVPLSIACWFKPTAIGVSQGIFGLFASGSASTNFWRLNLGATGVVQAQANAGSSENGTSSAPATAGAWNHAVGVYSANNARTGYVNGGNGGSGSTTATPAGIDRVSAGIRDSSTQNQPFGGQLGSWALWNSALTAEEVAALWNGWSPMRIRSQSLVLFCPFPGASAHDFFGRAATVSGAVASSDGPPMMLP
jgi:hypothetical protein